MIDTIISLLFAVTTVLGKSAGNKVRMQEIFQLLNLARTAVDAVDGAEEKLAEITEVVEQMAAEKRGPTFEEMDRLRQRSDDAHDRIQDAADLFEEGGSEPIEPGEIVKVKTRRLRRLPKE